MTGRLLLVFAFVVGFRADVILAQADTACSYSRCALGILPRLAALDVVRGDREERVGSLAFLFPRDVRRAFGDNELASRRAARAFSLRRIGSVLTMAGATVAVAGGIRAIAVRGSPGSSAALAAIGLSTFGASVPVHFAADAELSRAVWEYNRRLVAGQQIGSPIH